MMVEVVSDKGMDQKSVVDTISDACGCKVDLKDVKCIRSEKRYEMIMCLLIDDGIPGKLLE
jgi:hypothetical protein